MRKLKIKRAGITMHVLFTLGLLFWGGHLLNANAAKTFYYKVTAKVSDAGGGKVLASDQYTWSATYIEESTFTGSVTVNDDNATTASKNNFYLYFQATDGYYLENWSDQDNKTYPGPTSSWYDYINVNLSNITSTDKDNPTEFTYTAHFLKSKQFYYKVDATATEGGKVYVSDKSTTSPAYAASSSVTSSGEGKQTETTSTKSFYLYAQPDEGFYFNNWSLNGNSVSTSATYRASASSASEDEANPTVSSFTAVFGKYYVQVENNAEQSKLGTAAIDNEHNAIGDKVTLTATPFAGLIGSSFKDWIGPDGSVVSTENPYSFTVSDKNKGMYYAEFEGGNDLTKGEYVFINNKNANKNSQYALGFYGTSGTATPYTASNINRCLSYSIFTPVNNDLVHSSPAFVLKLTGDYQSNGNVNNVNFSANGAEWDAIAENFGAWIKKTYNQSGSYSSTLTWNATNSYYRIQVTVGGLAYGMGAVLDNDNYRSQPIEGFGSVRVPALLNSWSNNETSHYDVTPFTEDDNTTAYFGAMPSEGEKLGDSYYTTMYTVFPYKCLDGVKAYTVDKINSDNTLHLSEIESGVVPSNTPVVLRCKTTKPATNRLLPLIDEPASLTQTNLLKGELWLLQDETKTPEENGRTKFDASTMRVLSTTDGTFKNQNNSGYYVTYTTTNGTTTATGTTNTEYPYIVNNTAYLPVSEGAADSYSLALNVNGNDAAADNWTNAVSGHNDAASVAFTRSLASNKWQTLCLPFDVSEDELQAAFGEDVDLEEFNKSTVSGDNIVMSFKKASSIVAGKPYFIKPSKDFTSYVFDNKTMTQTDAESVDLGAGYIFKGTAQYNAEDIAGTYGSRARFTKYNADENVIELITPAANSSKIKPTRCYFVYPASGNGVKSLSFSFDDDPTTAISEVINGVKSTTRTDNRIFNLAGQFVGNDISKLPHGVYIKNGKKITK